MRLQRGPHGVVCGASIVGAAHRNAGKINQDSHLGDTFGEWSFMAVADGHGSAPHFRSDRGSRLAVEAARNTLRDWTSARFDETIEAIELGELPRLLHEKWKAYVEMDIRLDPLPASASGNLFLPYGSTLAVAIFSGTQGAFVQIGDGDLVVDNGCGRLCRPLVADAGLTGEQTYSLCLPDPVPFFRTALVDFAVTRVARPFALAATDGLYKSYGDEEAFVNAASSWRNIVATDGIESVSDRLQTWIAGVTEQGNGDDISLMIYSAN